MYVAKKKVQTLVVYVNLYAVCLAAANLSAEGDICMAVECCTVGPSWHLQSFYGVATSCLKIKQRIYDIASRIEIVF